jgi:sec-independent protein translocase protein TatC
VCIRVIRGPIQTVDLPKTDYHPMALRDIFKFRDLPDSETSKPFLEHLEDLRWTIVKMAITLSVAMIVCFAFRSALVRFLQAPLRDVGSQIGTLKALGITDSIVISFHLAFYAGIVLSFPLLLYFVAEFVLPALTAVERRFLFPAIGVSFALFLLGVTICYFWLLPKTILFFFRDTESLGWAPTWTVQQYYSFVTRFTIGFGLAFELPVVVLALVRFGLITYKFMARTRPYAVVLIFILATIITPTPDILTLIAMALPMCLLYESCIWIAWLMERRRLKQIAG